LRKLTRQQTNNRTPCDEQRAEQGRNFIQRHPALNPRKLNDVGRNVGTISHSKVET
jgi:hypothetical protein